MRDGARRTSAQDGHTGAVGALGCGHTTPHVAKLTAEQTSLIKAMASTDRSAIARADELRGEQGRLLETLYGEPTERQAAAIWHFLENVAEHEGRGVWLLVLADLVDRTRDDAPLRDLLSTPHTQGHAFGASVKTRRFQDAWRLLMRVRTHWRAQRHRREFLNAYRVPLTPEQRAELEADRALTHAAARTVLKRGLDLEQRYSRAAEQ